MQQYTIGRSSVCHIRIPDIKDRTSREHAMLKVMDNGKIFITDSSTNGTYVNGVKIAPHVEYPVKRGDVVSFANEYELDWELVAKPKRKRTVYLYAATGLAVAGAALFFLLRTPEPEPVPFSNPGSVETTVRERKVMPADTAKQAAPDTAAVRKPEHAAGTKPVAEEPGKEEQQAADTSRIIIF